MYLKPLMIIFMSVAPFLLSLQGDFVFDDTEAIVKNKDISSESWLDCFSNDFWGTSIKSNHSHKSYRPLTIITFRYEHYCKFLLAKLDFDAKDRNLNDFIDLRAFWEYSVTNTTL